MYFIKSWLKFTFIFKLCDDDDDDDDDNFLAFNSINYSCSNEQ